MKTLPCLFAILVLAAPSPGARGEESVSSPDSSGHSFGKPAPDAQEPSPAVPAFQPVKSAGVANALTLGITALAIPAGIVLFANNDLEAAVVAMGGLIVLGPSTGQFYAGSPRTGLLGLGIRSLGALLIAAGMGSSPFGDLSDGEGGDSKGGGNGTLGTAGVLLVVGGVFYGLVETQFAVNRANERAREQFESRMSLTPALLPVGDGRVAPGLAFNASF